jgi:hypothetical protein
MRHPRHVIALLHRIEAQPRLGEYALTLRTADGHETTLIMTVDGASVTAPSATLPSDWGPGSESYEAAVAAVLAVDRARSIGPRGRFVVDVDGGWDVSLGNVVMDSAGGLRCVADGPMEPSAADLYSCAVCGARAQLVDAEG